MSILQDTHNRFHNYLMWFQTQELLVWGGLSHSCQGHVVVQQVPALEVEVVIHHDNVLANKYFSVVDQMHKAGQKGWGLSLRLSIRVI